MALDDAGDKTEQPTPRRRQEAREEGQIARSPELTAAIALLTGLLLLKSLGPGMMGNLLNMTRALGDPPAVTAGGLMPWIQQIIRTTVDIALPFLLLLTVVTAAGTLAQSGIVLTWNKVGFKPDRLNPVNGLKRLVSSDALTRMLLGLVKVAVLSAIAYYSIRDRIGTVLGSGGSHPAGIYALAAGLLFDLALRMALVLLVLGIVDYLWQRWQHERRLRMTKQEVREELKRMEGDPLLKQRRRQIQMRLAMQRIQREVPRADVVVTNPTEYAIALRYDETTMGAPRVTAKGKDLLAARIRQLAQQYGVPVVERPPLARALYAAVEVGHEVPPAFYRAVAEVLAYVYQLSRKTA